MRVDKYLNSVNLTKRRSIALDMIKNKVVLINGKIVKPSKEVVTGDEITLNYLNESKKYKVLQIPKTKTIPKSAQEDYVKEIS
jgi:ribosomal 50S subunit-recycling heat shock protein